MGTKRKIIALILAITTLFLCSVPVYAESSEEFISEVSLIYRDSVEDAKKAIKDTDWKLYEKDLNANADIMFDDGVYLIYKTSTNVEDSITDLRVMDMYGGYSSTNYELQLQKTRDGYLEIISTLSVAIAEFKALYEAGDEMAALAYRQMNFYQDKKVSEDSDETGLLMGDFLLNVPSEAALVQVLMEGNVIIIANLVRLLAIGISGSSDLSLSDRLAEIYSENEVLDPIEYHDDAEMLSSHFTDIRADILRSEALKKEYDIDLDNPEDIEDEDMTEDDLDFLINYLALTSQLEKITIGETSLYEFIRLGSWSTEDLYPIVKAFTDGQLALIEMGQLDAILKYYNPTLPIAELTELVNNTEDQLKGENGEIERIDVYLGVDRSVFEGSFAMTNAAERSEALMGETWTLESSKEASRNFYIASAGIIGFDIAVMGVLKLIGKTAIALGNWSIAKYGSLTAGPKFILKYVTFGATKLVEALPAIYITLAGLVLVAMGLFAFSTVYNYYNPNYTPIPNVMVDVKESDLGDRYVKYTAAKVFGEKDKNADFNAYQGKEWIALYYTKDATAGNCLTPNFKYSESSSSVARRHQGVSMFGESKAFNLNSHVYDGDAKPVYLSLRYSTTKKAAAEDVPDVIGSMIITGALYTLTAVLGIGAGAGATVLVGYVKKKKNDTPQED